MDGGIDIQVRADGVYLIINRSAGAPRVSRMDVITLIESYGVTGVDFVRLNEALKSDREHIEIKISDNINVIQVDESASVEVSHDRMEAYITFSEPVNKGRTLTHEEIMRLILNAGITEADSEEVRTLLTHRRYARKYTIATGRQPSKGTDGFLQYHFDNSNLRPKPKIMDDGSVNFRDLGIFRLCNRGDVLVTSVPPKDGVDGIDVYGRVIPFPKGRLPLPIPKGRNTIISEDGLHLLADVSGQLVLGEGKINVSPCLEIQGNVDNSTGNIEFNGTVSIRGNVISGFKVKATGNIEVHGVCEAATLITDGNIVLGNGAQGSDKAELSAGGDITAKFIESCRVTAGGNITADSILKSIVKCDGNVILSGKNGLLTGGSLIAGAKLEAKTIGSPMGTVTEIEVGNNPTELTTHKQKVAEYEKLKVEFEKCDVAVNTLTALNKKGQLSEEKKATLMKMVSAKSMLREKMTKLQLEIDNLVQSLTINSGTVSATKVIRPGVRVTIGNAQMIVRDDIQNCKLRNDGAKIKIGPCV